MTAAALESQEREALLRVVTAASAANELEEILELVAEEARAATGAASLSVSRFEDELRRYRVLINVGEIGPDVERFPADEVYDVAAYPRLREMAATGRPYFSSVDDPYAGAETIAMLRRNDKTSDLSVAIDVEGRRWGGIWATTAAGDPIFQSRDLGFLEAIAAQIAAVVSRSDMFTRVSRMAYEDTLTGLANRRAFEERLERATQRLETGSTELAIMLCDVDRLKAINDTKGHAAGDEALRRVGHALVRSAATYPGSFVGRIGGDEFGVLLESRAGVAAGEMPEIVELAGGAQRLLADDQDDPLSVSCGVAMADPGTAAPSQLLSAADAAQYLAKRRGGNRVCTAAQAAEEDASELVPVPDGGFRARFWETAEEIARTLDGELAEASTLDRLEVVATAFTTAGDFAGWAIAFAPAGGEELRDVALGDNRERRRTGARVAPTELDYESYELADYPVTKAIVAAGSGSFTASLGDPDGDPAELALLEREGFRGVVGAAAGDEDGVFLVELVADREDAPFAEVDAPLRLAVRAAVTPQRHDRGGRSGPRLTRALDLALALPSRLTDVMDEERLCDRAAEELHGSFGCTSAQILAVADGRVSVRGERAPLPTPPGWSQPDDVGLIGRALSEGAPALCSDVSREPGYRITEQSRNTRSELAVPIRTGQGLWGAINLEDDRPGAFDRNDAQVLAAFAAVLGSIINAVDLYESLDRAYLGTAEALSAALESKDSYTAAHSRAIGDNSVAVGAMLGLEGDELRMLRYAATLHDIGKLAIRHEILNKPGPLDAAERAEIEQHTVIGQRILEPIEFLAPIRPIVRHAHERWDGRGYPDGLAGEAIPLGARIVFVCDAYDAMTTDRPYRKAMAATEAQRELREGAGRQFDANVVDALIEVVGAAD